MRLSWSPLVIVALVLCGACEVHVGTGNWDGGDLWGDDDDFWDSDPWDTTKKDAGTTPVRKRDASVVDEDAGVSARDAAVSDAGARDAAVQIDAASIDAAITEPDDEPTNQLTVEMAAQVIARGS